jgi:acid phosphatase family membrane protein YuiD
MHKYIFKQMKRNLAYNLSFCLLLALAGILFCLGTGLLLSGISTGRYINDTFTTIALPDAAAIRRYAVNRAEVLSPDEVETSWGTVRRDDESWARHIFDDLVADYMVDEILNDIAQRVYQSGEVHMDTRHYYGAWSPDVIALRQTASSGIIAPGSGGQSAAFIAQCTEIIETFQLTGYRDDETGEWRRQLLSYAQIMFTVEETLLLHPRISAPQQIMVTLHVQDANSGYFFTEGGRYFISGNIFVGGRNVNNPQLTQHSLSVSFPPLDRTTVTGAMASYDELTPDQWLEIVWRIADDLPTEDDFPMDITGFVIDTNDTRDFLFALGDMTFEEASRSPMGEAIHEAVNTADKNSNRLNIITTGNLESIFMFNQHRVQIEAGRGFTRQEYESGARVVVIPRILAEENGLAVGDTLSLCIFEGQFRSVTYTVSTGTTNPDGTFAYTERRSYRSWQPGGFAAGMREAEPLEFEIIGIYFAPPARVENDPHGIPVNTIFIPDNAFPGFAPLYTDGETQMWGDDRAESPFLNTVIIPNGRIEEFRRSINALVPGYGNFFMFYDQGYSIVRAALDNLLRNAWFIFALCVAGWCIAALVFCLFFVLRKKKEANILYALGVYRKSRFRWVFTQCLVIIILAQGVAFAVSTYMYERILTYTVERTFIAEENEASPFADAAIVSGVNLQVEVRQEPLGIPLATLSASVILLLAAAGVTKSMNEKGRK